MSEEFVTITYGADTEKFSTLVGISLNAALPNVKQYLSVPSDAKVLLNDKEPTMTSVLLKSGDIITFYKESGKKGY